MTKLRILPVLLSACALVACSTGADSAAEVTAILDSPLDATVTWHENDPGAAGHAVEFATEPGGEFTTLEFAPSSRDSYRHPDLIPDTTFSYRVRTYFGPTTENRGITLPPGELDDATQATDHQWMVPTTVPGPAVPTASIRTSADGAPTDFRATVVHANGIRFTWTDRASDEDGFLLEVKASGAADYKAAVVLEPNVNSAGLITLPEEKSATYRVRAFYWGPTSNVATVKSGPDPDAR
ncbi:MAG: fibronectin type III domain-containing protein [Umezawaea sp.]